MRSRVFLFIAFFLSTCLYGCSDPVTPKPRGYFRIQLPEHSYETYKDAKERFSFEYSTLSRVLVGRSEENNEEWLYVDYPPLKCKLHITYFDLKPSQEDMAFEDNHKLVFKHSVAADAIVEKYFDDDVNRVHATFYDIKGNAATPAQFAITDSLGQLFRGSMYFFCHPNKDSLAPVVEYVDEDIIRLIESFRWKD